MNIEQQLKDRFDRSIETDVLPEPDLAAAIAGGRRSRRRRSMSYAVGSLAVAAVAATAFGLAGPHAQTVPDGGSFAGAPATDYVAGTTIDTDLAAAIAAADPTLPAPTSVQPIDPATETGLPVALFGPPATGWMLTYEVDAGAHVSIMVSSDVPERSPSCPDGGTVSSTADGVSVCKDDRIITDANEPGPEQLYRVFRHIQSDGPGVLFVEQRDFVEAPGGGIDRTGWSISDDQAKAIVDAPGLVVPAP